MSPLPKYLVNGESKAVIPVSDRGLQYGDGLFETIEVIDSRPVFLDAHLQRLDSGCQRLQIPSPDKKVLLAEVRQLCANQKTAVLKIILSRGSGGRGYLPPEALNPSRIISLHPKPDYPDHFYESGVNTRVCQTRLGINPLLAGIKHLNRLEQVMARLEWHDQAINEGIMLDIENHVVEGVMTNVFLVKNSVITTPVIHGAGVKGIVRQIVILLAEKQGIKLTEEKITLDELLNSDEIFLTNSIVGIWPVKTIDQHAFQVGSITRKIRSLFLEYKLQEMIDVV